MQDKLDALIGCLLGTAVGDALGLGCEGMSKQRLEKYNPYLDNYHFFFGKGFVSDDTEHTVMIAQALITSRGDITLFKRQFAWKLRFWLLGLPAGIGYATLRAILKLWLGFSPNHSGVYSAGNGPAMRSAIIGVCYGHDKSKLRDIIAASTRITHTDPKAEYAALAVAIAAYLASLKQFVKPSDYLENLRFSLENSDATEFIALMQKTIESVERGESLEHFAKTLGLQQGISGYVYHTVPMVTHSWLRHQNDYRAAVIEIISCGGDTDTTAAILGGIIGAAVGKSGIPTQWIDNLWEFPRTTAWMETLGQRLNTTCCQEQAQHQMFVFLPLILLRNLFFMTIVVFHGIRRLFPPY